MFSGCLDDGVWSDVPYCHLVLDHVLQQMLSYIDVQRHIGIYVHECDHAAQGPFYSAHVRLDVFRDEIQNLIRDYPVTRLHLRFKNGDARFKRWGFDLHHHSLLEA